MSKINYRFEKEIVAALLLQKEIKLDKSDNIVLSVEEVRYEKCGLLVIYSGDIDLTYNGSVYFYEFTIYHYKDQSQKTKCDLKWVDCILIG